jgi:hypothetical protein
MPKYNVEHLVHGNTLRLSPHRRMPDVRFFPRDPLELS